MSTGTRANVTRGPRRLSVGRAAGVDLLEPRRVEVGIVPRESRREDRLRRPFRLVSVVSTAVRARRARGDDEPRTMGMRREGRSTTTRRKFLRGPASLWRMAHGRGPGPWSDPARASGGARRNGAVPREVYTPLYLPCAAARVGAAPLEGIRDDDDSRVQ